ncbi:MAG: DUF488 family protein [Pseudomonadota bacterium]
MARLEAPSIWTIGHSSHSYAQFLALLRGAEITAVADVRSSPFSRHSPQYNAATLKADLKQDSVAYSFLGKELGGRPPSGDLFRDGIADYERMAQTAEFREGLDRVIEGARAFRIVLMCSEHDPLDCHRCLLVARALSERNLVVRHVLSDARQKTQSEIEEILLANAGQDSGQDDLFASRSERLAAAYRQRARKVAYALSGQNRPSTTAAE